MRVASQVCLAISICHKWGGVKGRSFFGHELPNYAQKRAFTKNFANRNSKIKNSSAKTHCFETNKVSKQR